MKSFILSVAALIAVTFAVKAASSMDNVELNSLDVDYSAIHSFIDKKPAEYQSLLDRFVAADTTLTLEEVSILYYGSRIKHISASSAKGENATSKEANTSANIDHLLKEKNFTGAYEACIDKNLVSPMEAKTQLQGFKASLEISNLVETNNFRIRLRQLLNVILASGDGKSTDTAFKVVNVDDEYVIINLVFAAQSIKSQSLLHEHDNSYDKMEVVFADQTVSMYFEVTLWMEYLKDIFN